MGGGDKAHIGTVAVSQPRLSLTGNGSLSCTTSVFNLVGHKDDQLAVALCEYLCINLNEVIVVTAGVHIDNASPKDLEAFKSLLTNLSTEIFESLKA